jgi:hypothetical protein
MRGPSLRNTRFVKRSLTMSEAMLVVEQLDAAKSRWNYLFSINKWKPTDPANRTAPSSKPSSKPKPKGSQSEKPPKRSA